MARPRLSVNQYTEGILAGNRAILSQAITVIESNLSSDNILASEILQILLPYSGKSFRIGITGVPGVGKSTFIEQLGMYLLQQNKRLCVLAIDPSSQISKGSIMGDKTRMELLSMQQNTYIRPSPTSNSLGGVARRTRETIILCEAAGFDTLLIETVGVGQSEIAVREMTDFFLLLMLAGAGDELQGVKRGIMEVADALIITKDDKDNVNASRLAKMEYQNALHLFPPKENKWYPPVLTCSSIENKGFEEIWQMLEAYIELTKVNNTFEPKRQAQNLYWMHQNIKETIYEQFYAQTIIKENLKIYEDKVLQGTISAWQAAQELLKMKDLER